MRLGLAVLAMMVAAPAYAAEPLGADAPISTASSSPSVAEQIDAYLRSSPALERPDDTALNLGLADDRKPHGEISIGIGTGGYRSFYARTDLPLGENGRLSIAIEQNRWDGGRFGGPSAYAVGDGIGPGRVAPLDRQRCDLESMTPTRSLDRMGGPHGRCRGSILER